MATLTSTGTYTLAQLIKMLGPDNRFADIYDVLRRRTTVYDDMPWTQANMPDKHRMTVRDGTGNPQFVGIGSFATPSTINARQIDEYVSMLEDYSQLDDRFEALFQDVIAERDRIDKLKVGDITAAFATNVFYGNRGTNIFGFDGFASRANVLNDPRTAATYVYTNPIAISAGNTTNLSSIYLVQWGQQMAFGVHGQGGVMGVETKNLGLQPLYNATGLNPGIQQCYTTRIRLTAGLAVEDPRAFARIANIDVTNADPWTTYTLQTKLNAARTFMNPVGTVYAYVSQALFAKTQDFLQNKVNVWYKVDEFGRPYFEWMGFTWRIAEQISNTEAQIS